MTPKVTIIIPTLNEAEHISACLASMEAQDYPADLLDVIVVDNGSTDGTVDLAKSAGVQVLEEPRKSAYWARNLGIENTTSDWIAFTDADCLADPGWITNLVQCADQTGAMLVGGLIRYEMVTDTLGNRLLIEKHQPDHLRTTIEQHHGVAGGNMFVCRRMFSELGLFNVIAWGSDIDYSRRVAALGHRVSFAENAVVSHQCDLSNWEYWRRSFETRYGQVLLFDERRGLGAAIRNIVSLPWRPGFRSGSQRFRSDAIAPANAVIDWVYRWVNRWMEFIGEQYAIVTKS